MITKHQLQLTQNVIPDGEGFNALPIAFNYVIASARCEAISRFGEGIASTEERRLAMMDK